MISIVFIHENVEIPKALNVALPEYYSFYSTNNVSRGLTLINEKQPDAVFIHLAVLEKENTECLSSVLSSAQGVPIIVVAALTRTRSVIQAIRDGASDFLPDPFEIPEFIDVLNKNLWQHRSSLIRYDRNSAFRNLIGKSKALMAVKEEIVSYAQSESPVLLIGESGTGKEIVARIIHQVSPRKEGPYIAKNCAAIPITLLETEIYGSEKGAFTDAVTRQGSFEQAHNGSLFLDEIGEMALRAQTKLLRVIEENTVTRIGGSKRIPIDVRIISASNKNLKKAIRRGRFREDLFYRISMLPIHIPPLRERKDDIPLLVEHFIVSQSKESYTIDPLALEKLISYAWPGNVRELKSVLLRACLICKGKRILPQHIILY